MAFSLVILILILISLLFLIRQASWLWFIDALLLVSAIRGRAADQADQHSDNHPHTPTLPRGLGVPALPDRKPPGICFSSSSWLHCNRLATGGRAEGRQASEEKPKGVLFRFQWTSGRGDASQPRRYGRWRRGGNPATTGLPSQWIAKARLRRVPAATWRSTPVANRLRLHFQSPFPPDCAIVSHLSDNRTPALPCSAHTENPHGV